MREKYVPQEENLNKEVNLEKKDKNKENVLRVENFIHEEIESLRSDLSYVGGEGEEESYQARWDLSMEDMSKILGRSKEEIKTSGCFEYWETKAEKEQHEETGKLNGSGFIKADDERFEYSFENGKLMVTGEVRRIPTEVPIDVLDPLLRREGLPETINEHSDLIKEIKTIISNESKNFGNKVCLTTSSSRGDFRLVIWDSRENSIKELKMSSSMEDYVQQHKDFIERNPSYSYIVDKYYDRKEGKFISERASFYPIENKLHFMKVYEEILR